MPDNSDGIYRMPWEDVARQASAQADALRQSAIESSPIDLNQGVYERRPLSEQQQAGLDSSTRALFEPLHEQADLIQEMDRNNRLGSTRNSVAQAYNRQRLDMEKQKLNNASKEAAMVIADRQGYTKALQAGLSPVEAAAQFPRAITPSILQTVSRPGPDDFESVTEKFPAVDATPAVEAQPGRSGIMGLFSRPEIPAQPAIPAQPERTVTRKVPKVKSVTEPDVPTVNTKSEYDALPSGAIYVSKNGKKHRKP